MTRVCSKSGRFIALLPDSMQGGFVVVVTSDGVEYLASRWPCNGIPCRKSGGYGPIRFEYAGNGDLVDVTPNLEDINPDCGGAILALCEDAQTFGKLVMAKRRAKV